MQRSYYSDSIQQFLKTDPNSIVGRLVKKNEFDLEKNQRDAWFEEIKILQIALASFSGSIYFEYSIPRMGTRADVILLINSVVFVLEFKIHEKHFNNQAIDQVWDYALDLKNFHEPSHNQFIAPILIATDAKNTDTIVSVATTPHNDRLLFPVQTNTANLIEVIKSVLLFAGGATINRTQWENGRYCPTPTIIEAALALYSGHSVADITRNDASDLNLQRTTKTVSKIIEDSKTKNKKSICFVTGVPGAGKTLVGLNIATQHIETESELYSVFLSGNGPLVTILREALARDKVTREKSKGNRLKKGEALSEVKSFIQNVHTFRDDCLADPDKPPVEHVALFDEAQRAWNKSKTMDFMKREKGIPNFNRSEPEYLISCLDRHPDWAVVVCLVGGGQEINTGEAGITEWFESLERSFKKWNIYVSPNLLDSEYATQKTLTDLKTNKNISFKDELHLSVSMRSFRAENLSLLVKQTLDLDTNNAKKTLNKISNKYPIALTRDLDKAKNWLRGKARGTERYGIVVSSQAERLKPYAIDVKTDINPIHWFLDDKDDVRSSYYLEDVATEFHIQGLELDWACVTWDADFRFSNSTWEHWSFRGNKWQHINKTEGKKYQKNAYRVLLTRARQGMVIVVPRGDTKDHTRPPEFYNGTFEYLKSIGFQEI